MVSSNDIDAAQCMTHKNTSNSSSDKVVTGLVTVRATSMILKIAIITICSVRIIIIIIKHK